MVSDDFVLRKIDEISYVVNRHMSELIFVRNKRGEEISVSDWCFLNSVFLELFNDAFDYLNVLEFNDELLKFSWERVHNMPMTEDDDRYFLINR